MRFLSGIISGIISGISSRMTAEFRRTAGIWLLVGIILFPTGADVVRAANLPHNLPQPQDFPQPRQDMQSVQQPELANDSTVYLDAEVLARVPESTLRADSIAAAEEDGPLTEVVADNYPYGLDGKRIFNPDPTRAVWMSALFPCLGQIYNRRYWKLPIIVAGFMGLGYGLSWNSRMYSDYRLAYADIMDDDPDTKSYLDFFPPNVDESSLDKSWLEQTLKSRRDYYRRNKELCIICCVGLYLLCMLDAYVDAHLMHYDISEDLSMDVAPTMIVNPGYKRPSAALNWTFTF